MLLASCTAIGSNDTSTSGDGPIPADVEDAIVSLLVPPLEIGRAERSLVEECMAKRGFLFPPGQIQLVSGPPVSFASLIGLLPISEARDIGYGSAIGRTSQARSKPKGSEGEKEYLRSLPPRDRTRYWNALFGLPNAAQVQLAIPVTSKVISTSRTGCWSNAREQLFGGLDEWLRATYLPQVLLSVRDGLMASPLLDSSLGAYRKCMARAGFVVDDPGEALQLAQDRFGNRPTDGPPDDAELSMATTDAQCQEFAGIRYAAEFALQRRSNRWFTLQRDELVRLVSVQSSAEERALEVLSR